MEIRIENLEKIREAAREFIKHIGDHRVFAFYGKMGAGKTTFVKAICEELGVEDVITSPTFAIVNEYEASLTSHIEWPELIEDILPEDAVKVIIKEQANGTRSVTF